MPTGERRRSRLPDAPLMPPLLPLAQTLTLTRPLSEVELEFDVTAENYWRVHKQPEGAWVQGRGRAGVTLKSCGPSGRPLDY